MTEIKSTIKGLAVFKDHLTVALSSHLVELTPSDLRDVKYIIRDLLIMEEKMVKELTERDVE